MTEHLAPPILAPAPRTEPLVIPGRDPVPVTLLTGFLGAGKTTLLNRILNGQHGLRVGVLVNDFGAINIDAELIDGIEENTINLTNGCVCCEIRDDLVNSLEQLLTRTETIDYVILEASGVADPEGIVMTFLDQRYEKLLRLDSITCLVDAEGIFADGDNEALNMLKLRQIGFADLVVLNKVDLIGAEHLEVVKEWINHHLHRIRIIDATRCDVPLEVLLAVGRFDPAHVVAQYKREGENQEHLHGHGTVGNIFNTWSYETDRPFSLEALREMVRRELPASIYRCKGVVFAADSPDKRIALQIVGRRTEIAELDAWGDRTPRTQIVAIGSSFDRQELTNKFDASLAHAEAQMHPSSGIDYS
ncbi:Putative metal chaperone YciC [Symmachiella dynata]|uniref:Metal chaperone YciC n=1 Tax=Symmachiella dynata TaxID=2527995 RepID=A0A517ZQS5_9PLAN|nr:GTP-binding protein [Symmachiella dynata]QDU44849.1 Putative metal chaperone YciC [Symmachiella dynata]